MAGIIDNLKKSLSQLTAFFSVVAFLGGLLIMSPAGRFGSFVVMALMAIGPLVLGNKKLRILGIIAFIIGVAGTILLFNGFSSDPYFSRHRRNTMNQGCRYDRVVAAHTGVCVKKHESPARLHCRINKTV